MFLCTYTVLKASSCVNFSVIFATRASIVCIDSVTCDTIRVSLALAIRFFDISINRYTPTIDFKTEIDYLKYIVNYCLTRLDTLDEITPENPVPRDAPSDETPPPPQTTPEQINETTILSTESALQSAASNDVNNDENELEMLTMSNKRTFNEDSSEEDTTNPLPAKKAATSSPASEQSGTRVSKGRGGGDLPKISAFPANAPQPRGRGSSQGDKSLARTPRFPNNTGEGSASSAQGGRNRGPINRHPPLKPPGTF